MKEFEENDSKDDLDFLNRNEHDDSSSSNDLISPIQKDNNNNYPNYNVLNKKKLSFLEDYPEQNNDDLFGLNDDSHFYRYHLNDEQKEYLMPRNSTLISKILDFFFNW